MLQNFIPMCENLLGCLGTARGPNFKSVKPLCNNSHFTAETYGIFILNVNVDNNFLSVSFSHFH